MSTTTRTAFNKILHALDTQLGAQKNNGIRSLNAFISAAGHKPTFNQEVRESMGRHDQKNRKSPLDGNLICIKDNICTLGESTTCASGILDQFQSPFSASVVEQLQDAGAFVVGKTNLDEFGMGSHSTNSYFGSVRNRACIDGKPLSAGGSSGGSAVAVSTAQRLVALGTDTGGSVRLPAAYNGIYGFKPSYGLLSRWGIVAYANSLDTVGLMAIGSQQICDLFSTLSRRTHRDPTLINNEGFRTMKPEDLLKTANSKYRIGVPKEYNTQELDPKIRQIWGESLRILQEFGHSIHSVSLPSTRIALSAYYVIAAAEASSNLAKYDGVRYGKPADDEASGVASYAATRGSRLGEEVKRRILLGSYTLSAGAIDNHFIKAQKARRLVQKDFNSVFRACHPLQDEEPNGDGGEGVDFLLTPTTPTLPPTLDSLISKRSVDSFADDVLTVPASLAGLPAISVPIALSGNHQSPGCSIRHVGLQIIGQYGSDYKVLWMAAHLMKMVMGARARERAPSTPSTSEIQMEQESGVCDITHS